MNKQGSLASVSLHYIRLQQQNIMWQFAMQCNEIDIEILKLFLSTILNPNTPHNPNTLSDWIGYILISKTLIIFRKLSDTLEWHN